MKYLRTPSFSVNVSKSISITIKAMMEHGIDFDTASAAWRANKKKLSGGWFAYRCNYIHSGGKRCTRAVESAKKPPMYRLREDWVCRSISRNPDQYCWQHRNRQSRLTVTDGIGAEADAPGES